MCGPRFPDKIWLFPAEWCVPGGPKQMQNGRIAMLELIRNFMKKDEDGASAVEYGLLVAGIAALIVLIVFAFGGVIKGVFSNTCTVVKSNTTANASTNCNG